MLWFSEKLWITKKSISIKWSRKGQKWVDGRLPLPHSLALFKMWNKCLICYLFPSLPLSGELCPYSPPHPLRPIHLCHSKAYTDGFCTYLLLVKCLFMTYWGSCLVLCGALFSKKKKRVGYWYYFSDLMLLLMSFSFIKSFLSLLIFFIAEPLVIWKLLLGDERLHCS